ncbi:16S rRNA (guanine(527)-N(7))-methyltransferase RsmG [uncultured Sphingomonas sp.]|uniref:16S rRNA (guanine(527)-N(7))-methyltransferase RsmG n=1 Tax=uncultured Sphingomonas sp. TaxID=158754 RepID=UPI0035CC033A
MTEDEAKDWIADRFGASAVDGVGAIVTRVIAENQRQNLVSPSTIGSIWNRHAADSAQLALLGEPAGLWIDIGPGGGFPGMIVAMVRAAPMLLIEPRRKRAEFLVEMARDLHLTHVHVMASRVEVVREMATIISARAVASVEKLFDAGQACAMQETRWLLPRGRIEQADLLAIERDWQGTFHVKQSVTDRTSSILVAEGVCRR